MYLICICRQVPQCHPNFTPKAGTVIARRDGGDEFMAEPPTEEAPAVFHVRSIERTAHWDQSWWYNDDWMSGWLDDANLRCSWSMDVCDVQAEQLMQVGKPDYDAEH